MLKNTYINLFNLIKQFLFFTYTVASTIENQLVGKQNYEL